MIAYRFAYNWLLCYFLLQQYSTQRLAELQGKKSCTCCECGKCFPLPCNLVRHMIIHNDERRYSCTECGKCFKAVKVLKEHMNTHRAEKTYTCEDFGKCFTQLGSLQTHFTLVKSHTVVQNVENVSHWIKV